ncbi:MAG: DUF3006 domain-containing protein [Clostridia bacterium]|nr:DUF3006 domain-containing protein [Clostridia bacterium]
MRYIVDRIEEKFLVLEKEKGIFISVPLELIPDAQAGDCIDVIINKEETKDRQENAGRLMESLFVD